MLVAPAMRPSAHHAGSISAWYAIWCASGESGQQVLSTQRKMPSTNSHSQCSVRHYCSTRCGYGKGGAPTTCTRLLFGPRSRRCFLPRCGIPTGNPFPRDYLPQHHLRLLRRRHQPHPTPPSRQLRQQPSLSKSLPCCRSHHLAPRRCVLSLQHRSGSSLPSKVSTSHRHGSDGGTHAGSSWLKAPHQRATFHSSCCNHGQACVPPSDPCRRDVDTFDGRLEPERCWRQ